MVPLHSFPLRESGIGNVRDSTAPEENKEIILFLRLSQYSFSVPAFMCSSYNSSNFTKGVAVSSASGYDVKNLASVMVKTCVHCVTKNLWWAKYLLSENRFMVSDPAHSSST